MALLFKKTFSELLSDSKTFLTDNTQLTTFGPGSKVGALITLVANEVSNAYTQFNGTVASYFLDGASGNALDLYGNYHGIARRSATFPISSSAVRFYTSAVNFGAINNNADITIPAGTVITGTVNGVTATYLVTSDTTLLATAKVGTVPVQGTVTGTIYNVGPHILNSHNFSGYSDNANKSLLVDNIESISSGADAESDDNYRYIIANTLANRNLNNLELLRLKTLRVPGVADVKIVKDYYGAGHAMFLIKGTTPVTNEGVVNQVQFMFEDNAASSWATAAAPTPVEVNIRLKVNYTSNSIDDFQKEQVKNNIQIVCENLIDNLDIGQVFSPNALATLMLTSDSRIASIGIRGRAIDLITYNGLAVEGTYVTKEFERLTFNSIEII